MVVTRLTAIVVVGVVVVVTVDEETVKLELLTLHMDPSALRRTSPVRLT